jgi:hypothetical protein
MSLGTIFGARRLAVARHEKALFIVLLLVMNVTTGFAETRNQLVFPIFLV